MIRSLFAGHALALMGACCFAPPDAGGGTSAGDASASLVDPGPVVAPAAVDPAPAAVAPAAAPVASSLAPATAIADATATAADIAAPAAASVAQPVAPIAAEDVMDEIDEMIAMAGKSHVASFSASIVLDTGVYVTISAARCVTPKAA